MLVSGWVGDLAMRIASERRDRRKIALLHPRVAEVFTLPHENDVTGKLVLKVRGTATAIRIVRKPRGEQLLGLFAEDREHNNKAVSSVLRQAREEERDAA